MELNARQNGVDLKNMALVRDLVFKRGPSITKILKSQSDLVTLKPIKKLTIKFDPFSENVKHIRDFSFLLHSQKILQSNPKCVIKTDIVTDRSEPTVIFSLTNEQELIFKCGNLTCLEIFKLINKIITPLAPKEEDTYLLTERKGKGKRFRK